MSTLVLHIETNDDDEIEVERYDDALIVSFTIGGGQHPKISLELTEHEAAQLARALTGAD